MDENLHDICPHLTAHPPVCAKRGKNVRFSVEAINRVLSILIDLPDFVFHFEQDHPVHTNHCRLLVHHLPRMISNRRLHPIHHTQRCSPNHHLHPIRQIRLSLSFLWLPRFGTVMRRTSSPIIPVLVARPLRGHIARLVLRSAYLFDKLHSFPDIRVGVLRNLRCCRFVPRNTLSARLAPRILHDVVFDLLGTYPFVLRDLLYASLGAFVCCGLRPLASTFVLLGLMSPPRPNC